MSQSTSESKDKKDTENNLSDKEYNRLKIQLQYIEKMRKSRWLIMLITAFSILISMLIGWSLTDSFNGKLSITIVVISLVIGVLLDCILYAYTTLLLNMKENSIRKEMLDYEATNMQAEIGEDIFENSIKMSYKYLDQYYLQTREHAQRGFFVTVCVSILGAVLIGIGIIAMFLDHVAPSYITCASGVITEFIAAIFFYLYNKTIASMSKYHNKLVLSQNISIALKVADSLPSDDKVKAKNSIVNELLKDINIHLVKEDSASKQP